MPIFKWELVGTQDDPDTGAVVGALLASALWRAKVPGGWLVRIVTIHSVPYSKVSVTSGVKIATENSITSTETMTFMPDAQHAWDGGTLP